MADTTLSASAQKMFLCKCCGNPAGTDFYIHPYTGKRGTDGIPWGDAASCLCGTCSTATAIMTTVSEFNDYKADSEMKEVDEEGEMELILTP